MLETASRAMFTEKRRVQVLRVQAVVITEGGIAIEREPRSEVVLETEVTSMGRHREVIVGMVHGQAGQEAAPSLHPVKGC